MNFKRHINIGTKVNILLLLPLITLVFFAYNIAFYQYQQLRTTQYALQYLYFSKQLTDLVYQLQVERGLSAGAITRQGKVYQQSLVKQRQLTDEKANQLNQIFAEFSSYLTDENHNKYTNLMADLTQLTMIRRNIDQGNNDFFEFYSHLISELLNLVSLLQKFSVSPEFHNLSRSYINILWLGEFAGQERGALNGVFSSQQFSAKQFSSISSYIAGQSAELRSFNNIALSKHKKQIQKILSHPAHLFVEHSREIIFHKGLRNDALNGIQSLIGYGGLIHDFKNYVIRGDSQYTARFQQKFNTVLQEIENYRNLPNINSEEKNALNTIKNTFQQYQSNLATVSAMKRQQADISKIDKRVIVNDKPALKAIKLLRYSLSSQNPLYWWQQATKRIQLIYKTSNSIENDLILYGQQFERHIQTILFVYSTLTLTIVLVACFIGIKLRSRIVNEIKYIAKTMRMSQKKQALDQLLTVSGNDEISEMAIAFNNLITERKAVEEKLLLSTRIFNETQEGIIVTSANGKIVNVNPAFYKITGYSLEDVMGKNPSILSSGKQDSRFYSEMWQSLINQGYWKGEIWNHKKNGELYAEFLTISTLKTEEGTTTYYVGLFSDITEHKKAEKLLKEHSELLEQEVRKKTYDLKRTKDEAEQANKSKSEFLANMSHELRTPLHGILSFSQLGIKNISKVDLEKQETYFVRIKQSGERLLVLLNDLLDLAKLEAGKMQLDIKENDLKQLVETCIAEQEANFNEKSVAVYLENCEISTFAKFDAARIGQVVTNLLSNARKFTQTGRSIFINFSEYTFVNTDNQNIPGLLCSIRDQGIGIPEEELSTVFDKFIQSSKTKSNAGGTGLGLAICQEIMIAHHGKIWAENNEDVGSVFKFVIPLII